MSKPDATKPEYITDYVLRNAELFPDKLALVHEDASLTWKELATMMTAAAEAFHGRLEDTLNARDESEADTYADTQADSQLESRPKPDTVIDGQQVIGMLLANSWEFVVAYLGVLHAGHIVMPLDPTFKRLENMSITGQISPVFTITDPDFTDNFDAGAQLVMVSEVVPSISEKVTPKIDSGSKLKRSSNEKAVAHEMKPGYIRLTPATQVASVLFTSGTTGAPKATPYTHANYLWNVEAVTELWQWTPDDTILSSLPLSHWHGLAMALTGAIRHGNTFYLQTRFNEKDTLESLQSGMVSMFMHVPIAYFKLAEFEASHEYDISPVRICISGSSYLPPAIWHKFKDKYGHDILERYGASEMGLLASNRLDERVPGSVGYLLPGVEARIEADGQLAMRSPGLFPGYYHNEQASSLHRTADGWWLSGDIGEFDSSGRLTLKGRIQEKMKKHGYTVYPRDVEWAVLKHEGVRDIVVMSLQDPAELSDTFVYFVVSDISEAEITAYCKENLPAAWRPDRIIVLPEIPKTRSGKPVLRALREMVL